MSNIEPRKPFQIDLNKVEEKNLDRFINDGLPGISTFKDEKIAQAKEMYLNGASYDEISARIGTKKVMVMFVAYKYDWYNEKIELFKTLMETINSKVEIAHVRSMDLLTDMMAVYENYYRRIIDTYRLSKDRRILESTDLDGLKTYMKCMDQLQKFRNPGQNGKNAPLMGLNLPQGGTVTKIDDNTIEVSPNNSSQEKDVASVLEALAELRRQREDKK